MLNTLINCVTRPQVVRGALTSSQFEEELGGVNGTLKTGTIFGTYKT